MVASGPKQKTKRYMIRWYKQECKMILVRLYMKVNVDTSWFLIPFHQQKNESPFEILKSHSHRHSSISFLSWESTHFPRRDSDDMKSSLVVASSGSLTGGPLGPCLNTSHSHGYGQKCRVPKKKLPASKQASDQATKPTNKQRNRLNRQKNK